MERLSDFAADIINDLYENSDWYGDYSLIEAAINRLAAIEDILGDEYDLNRLRELAQADKEGISPCTFCRFNPPSSGDGKPCCMCPAEAALRREQDKKGGSSE